MENLIPKEEPFYSRIKKARYIPKPYDNYMYSDGFVYIHKQSFKKVHNDYKSTEKGNEKMLILKGGVTTSILVKFIDDLI